MEAYFTWLQNIPRPDCDTRHATTLLQGDATKQVKKVPHISQGNVSTRLM